MCGQMDEGTVWCHCRTATAIKLGVLVGSFMGRGTWQLGPEQCTEFLQRTVWIKVLPFREEPRGSVECMTW